MPTSIEVRYLSHNDLGKTIQLHGRYAGLTGTLDGLETSRTDHPYILLDLEFERGHKQMYDFHPSDRVTITGQASPATGDPHGLHLRGEPQWAGLYRPLGFTTIDEVLDRQEPEDPDGETQAVHVDISPKPVGPRRVPATGPMGDLQDIARAAVDYTTRLAKELRETVQGQDTEAASSTPHLPPPVHATSHASIKPRGEDQGAACPCFSPAWHGHYSPECPQYCSRCNYQQHICPGCGDPLRHGTDVCTDCTNHLDQGAASGPRGEDQGASDYGPICCNGDCCGAGSYCCGHPDNKHTHAEACDCHIAAYDNPTTCVRCGKHLDDYDNTSCEAPQ